MTEGMKGTEAQTSGFDSPSSIFIPPLGVCPMSNNFQILSPCYNICKYILLLLSTCYILALFLPIKLTVCPEFIVFNQFLSQAESALKNYLQGHDHEKNHAHQRVQPEKSNIDPVETAAAGNPMLQSEAAD